MTSSFVALKGRSCVTVVCFQLLQQLGEASAGAVDAVSVLVTWSANLGDAKVQGSPGDSCRQ